MRLGAAAGAAGVALFVVAALVQGSRPEFDAPAREVAAWYGEERTRIQLSAALCAAAVPLLVWFLATVVAVAREAGPDARRAAAVAFGCGLVFLALFTVDVTTLAVGALRPENMAAEPELAAALRDLELLLMGTGAFPASAMLAALALLALREAAVWPRRIGWLAAAAAAVYLLRVGTVFTTEGPFAADGVLGIYVPVAALVGWIFVASADLTRRTR